jgi:hypothetical protein
LEALGFILTLSTRRFDRPTRTNWTMNSRQVFLQAFVCLTALSVGVFSVASEVDVSVVTDSAPAAPAAHGAAKILAALKEKGVAAEQVDSLDKAKGKSLIVAGLAKGNGPAAKLRSEIKKVMPDMPESLAISILQDRGKPYWLIAGSDARGLMYGELDVADRIGWSTDRASPLSELRETTESPAATTRAVSIYTMNRTYWESRFYDRAYWARYLDTLAHNRFNSLVIIFGYENGGFLAPCYPYFFDVEGFADVRMVGLSHDGQKRNLAALNDLIQMAHDHGVDVTIGIWDHIYRGGVQGGGVPGADEATRRPTPGLVWGVTGENLLPYTRAALAKFIRLVPKLDAIQFRMHDESGLKVGEQEVFWRDVFQMIKRESPNLRLDLRAKGLPDSIIQAGLDTGVKLRITTKYWMEQMGLPFHPTHVNPPDQRNRRHGYADLLRYPQQYKMHWRLWNGGTARILLWGDPDYVRRFVESTHLYDGDGFEVNEPLATKMEGQPHDARPFDLLKPQYRYYDYEFERYWHFFQAFGRLGYNPKTPTEVWHHEFERRFGEAAAPSIESALHRASWILPRIVASSYPYRSFPMTVGWAEKQHLGDLPTFAKAEGSDVAQFENFDEEAERLIDGGETAKVRPQETSRWFAETAEYVLEKVAEAEKARGSERPSQQQINKKEFDSTIVDLKILGNLALYHSRRIPAAVSYRLYVRTKDAAALDDAIASERGAVEAWRQLVAAAGDVYADDLMMGARSRNLCGHWKDELAALEKGLSTLERQRREAPASGDKPAPRYRPIDRPQDGIAVVHRPVTTAPAGKPLTIAADVSAPSSIKWVRLRFRSVNQYDDYQTLTMPPSGAAGHYEATVPGEKIPAKFDFMYFLEVMDNQGQGKIYPDLDETTPYFVVRLVR